MEEKKPKVNEIKMKAKKTRNELKVSDLENYPLKNEERMKNGEERRKTFTDLLTETSRKHYGSTLTCIFFTETIFLPKTAEMHSQGDDGSLEQPPFAYL